MHKHTAAVSGNWGHQAKKNGTNERLSNWAKGRITDLSPSESANEFVGS